MVAKVYLSGTSAARMRYDALDGPRSELRTARIEALRLGEVGSDQSRCAYAPPSESADPGQVT